MRSDLFDRAVNGVDEVSVRSDSFRYKSVFDAGVPAADIEWTFDLFCKALMLEVEIRLEENCGKRDFCFVETNVALRLKDVDVGLFNPEDVLEISRLRSNLTLLADFGLTKPVSSFGFTVRLKLEVVFCEVPDFALTTVDPTRCIG